MDEIPPEVPGYRLTSLIGAGATSRVWRARRTADDALVAVKVRPGEADEEAVREFALLQSAADEHVVTLHETLALDGPQGPATALVLELFSGGSLAQVVAARGHLTPGETVTVIAPVASALAGLHDRGIVHGDLSPGNVLIDSVGRPALGDLGFSRLTGEVGGEVHGTDGFVAPEVLQGGDPDRAGDVHALGALAWLCLTGAAPGHVSERSDLAELIEDVPELVAVVESCLAGDPAHRPEADVVARAVYDAVPATPLRMTSPGDVGSGLTRRLRESAGVLEMSDWQRELVTASAPAPRRPWWRRRPKGAAPDPDGRGPGYAPLPGRGRHAAPKVKRSAASEPVEGAPLSVSRAIARAAQQHRTPRAALLVAILLGVSLAVLVPWQQLATAGEDRTEATRTTESAGGAVEEDRSGTGSPARATVLSDPQAPQQAPTQLAAALSTLREQVVTDLDVAALAELDEPDSPAYHRDRGLLEEMIASGRRYEGVDLTVRTASLERASDRLVVLRTTTDEGAYTVIGPRGEVERFPALYGQQTDLVLVWDRDAWRVRDVR